ncbi:hypothetical protein ACEE21_15205 [Clostridium baratii]
MEISLILDNRTVREYDLSYNGFKNSFRELMTLDGFVRSFEKGEFDRKELRKVNNWIRNVEINNKPLYRTLVFTVALINYSVVAFAEPNVQATFSKIDKLGYAGLSILKKIGFWLCLICCFVEILKSFINSDARDVWKIFFKYITIYLVLHFLPYAFQLISSAFEGM